MKGKTILLEGQGSFIGIVVHDPGNTVRFEKVRAVNNMHSENIILAASDLARENPGCEVQIIHALGRFYYDAVH